VLVWSKGWKIKIEAKSQIILNDIAFYTRGREILKPFSLSPQVSIDWPWIFLIDKDASFSSDDDAGFVLQGFVPCIRLVVKEERSCW
jgi:hypothetical protein